MIIITILDDDYNLKRYIKYLFKHNYYTNYHLRLNKIYPKHNYHLQLNKISF